MIVGSGRFMEIWQGRGSSAGGRGREYLGTE